MQKKESIMVVLCEFKIPSLGMTFRHDEARNSYPRDGIFSLHRTTIKDSYIIINRKFLLVISFYSYQLFKFQRPGKQWKL